MDAKVGLDREDLLYKYLNAVGPKGLNYYKKAVGPKSNWTSRTHYFKRKPFFSIVFVKVYTYLHNFSFSKKIIYLPICGILNIVNKAEVTFLTAFYIMNDRTKIDRKRRI